MTEIWLRPSVEQDINFVEDSWTKSSCGNHLEMTKEEYREYNIKHILHLLANEARILIACNVSEPDQILGYICYQPGDTPIVHYFYTKSLFRNFHICRELLEEVGIKRGDDILCSYLPFKIKDRLERKFSVRFHLKEKK